MSGVEAYLDSLRPHSNAIAALHKELTPLLEQQPSKVKAWFHGVLDAEEWSAVEDEWATEQKRGKPPSGNDMELSDVSDEELSDADTDILVVDESPKSQEESTDTTEPEAKRSRTTEPSQSLSSSNQSQAMPGQTTSQPSWDLTGEDTARTNSLLMHWEACQIPHPKSTSTGNMLKSGLTVCTGRTNPKSPTSLPKVKRQHRLGN